MHNLDLKHRKQGNGNAQTRTRARPTEQEGDRRMQFEEATRAKKTLRRMKFEGRRWVTLELEKNKIVGIR